MLQIKWYINNFTKDYIAIRKCCTVEFYMNVRIPLVRQFIPVNPAAQLHVYIDPDLKHAPPFAQGLLLHGSAET